jgi:uncharacterized protein
MARSPDELILEAIITTESEDGSMHVAPMGPQVSEAMDRWLLKPFQTSTTFRNLHRSSRCIVHVVDDALLLALAVLGKANSFPATSIPGTGFVLDAACHWFALSVNEWDISQPRALATCRVVRKHVNRPFFGWNRAKHAIVELAILASRIGMLDVSMMQNEMDRLKIMIEKTGGHREFEAFELLCHYIRSES